MRIQPVQLIALLVIALLGALPAPLQGRASPDSTASALGAGDPPTTVTRRAGGESRVVNSKTVYGATVHAPAREAAAGVRDRRTVTGNPAPSKSLLIVWAFLYVGSLSLLLLLALLLFA
jgi:hypothetical protein